MVNQKAVSAVAELLLAATFWGFGFIASVWALKSVDAFELTFVRFALGVGVSLPIVLFSIKRKELKNLFLWSFWPGIFLFGTLVFQTWGLHYTTATKSGFITTLYVVFVPVLEAFHLRRKIPWSLRLCVIGALVGTLLIVNVGLDSINIGDIWTFVCALFATLQIYYMGFVSPKVKHPFAFNTMQALWCLMFSVPFLFHDNLPAKLASVSEWPATAIWGVASLAFGSTVLAFFLQVKAQASLSPTVSSLLCLLESPIAMIFAMLLLQEKMGPFEASGAVMIFLSAVGASYIESTSKKKR